MSGEFVANDGIQGNLTDSLSRIIAFDAEGRAIRPVEDLHVRLREQLNAPLLRELGAGSFLEQEALAAALRATRPSPETFADLLHHPRPPLELLRQVKDFGKRHRVDPASPIPPTICLLLYYGSIVAALLRHNQRISQLSDNELREGISWVLHQPWLDDGTRWLLRDGLEHLRRGRHWWRR